MLYITPTLTIAESELELQFVTSSGPGGQHVNRVATAVHLKFDAANCPSLMDDVLGRLRTVAGRRMSRDGVIILKAQRYRSQERNRQDAKARLTALLREASTSPRRRLRSTPSIGIKKLRVAAKRSRGQMKRSRIQIQFTEE